MMDQMGEVEYAPGEPKGTPWHPHRGFETVTYIIDGIFDHQDSHGGGGTITNGDTQWMTAGAGLLHIEAPPEWLVQSGGLFHGIQLWVNLPRDAKMTTPKYQDLRSGEVALLTTPDAGATGAGDRGLGRRARRPGLDAHPDVAGARHHRARRPPRAAVGGRLQRARLRAQRPRHRRRRGAPDAHRASPPCSAPATTSPSPPTAARRAARRSSTWSSWAADRSASRWPGPARS